MIALKSPDLKKRDFLSHFLLSWNATFTTSNINSGWATTGLHPLNPDIVLNRFEKTIEGVYFIGTQMKREQ